ncbi:MAG TPA: hypothetical protein VGM82_13625 [Gemmatimonadaceae bacterium]|jgi:hypothetical protein
MKPEATAANNPEIGTAADHITISFSAPTEAVKLLDHTVIWPRARAAGVKHQWEASRTRASAATSTIAARRTLVPFLIEFWVELLQTGKHNSLPIAEAVKAALDALAH